MDRHIMVDIETLGTAADSVIVSIGAVEFDDTDFFTQFYEVVDIDSCLRAGLKPEGRTIQWWMGQSAEAREVFDETSVPLVRALSDLSNAFDWKDKQVWCNGLNFDIPILDTAYRLLGMETPWVYYNCRDFRTVKGMFSRDTWSRLTTKNESKHNALSDAKHQAVSLQRVWAAVAGGGVKWAA